MPGSFKRLVRNLRHEAELTPAERDAMLRALHLHTVLNGAGVLTGRSIRRRTMESLVAKHFAKEAMLVVVDGDGFAVESWRERSGFCLTRSGLAVARRLEAKARAESRAAWDQLAAKESA